MISDDIQILGATQVLIMSIVFLLKGVNRHANRIISIILLLVSYELLQHYLIDNGYYKFYPNFPWGVDFLEFALGVLFYAYVALMVGKIDKINLKFAINFIPIFIILFIMLVQYYSIPEYNRINEIRKIHISHTSKTDSFVMFISILYQYFYFLMSICILKRYSKKIKMYFSDIGKINLAGLKISLFLFIIVSIMQTILEFFKGHFTEYVDMISIFLSVMTVVIFSLIIIFAILQPEIFGLIQVMNHELREILEKKQQENLPRYSKNRLPAETEKKYLDKLLKLMDERKPFLIESLTIKQLAEMLNISSHHLSMLLNIHLKQNFYYFINRYRINEVINQLTSPEKKKSSILELAYNVGYNSKSTFNKMFKEITGLTPSEYRQKHI